MPIHIPFDHDVPENWNHTHEAVLRFQQNFLFGHFTLRQTPFEGRPVCGLG